MSSVSQLATLRSILFRDVFLKNKPGGIMKLIFSILVLLLLNSLAFSQSGRRPKAPKSPAPPPLQEANQTSEPEPASAKLQVTAEKNEDYRCSNDGSLERLLDPVNERVISSRNVDERAIITRRPAPAYTREARRNLVQGFVRLRLLLSADGRISRVRVVKGLRAGLTENAIRAACKITFRPAMKDGQPVSQWVEVEYAFRVY
jgi:TonB family protein